MAEKASTALFFAGVGAIFAAYLLKLFATLDTVDGDTIVNTVSKTASSLGALNT